eukprot:scaffold362490_cov41-Prasinocladus_malaysianus.AAC.1
MGTLTRSSLEKQKWAIRQASTPSRQMKRVVGSTRNNPSGLKNLWLTGVFAIPEKFGGGRCHRWVAGGDEDLHFHRWRRVHGGHAGEMQSCDKTRRCEFPARLFVPPQSWQAGSRLNSH